MRPPLIDMINATEQAGFYVHPVEEGKFFRFMIFRNDKLVKVGQKQYKNLQDGQIDVYSKLMKVL